MEINGLGSVYSKALKSLETSDPDKAADFKNILADALEQAEDTDRVDQLSTEALLTGDVNNLHDAVLASEKAEIALRLTVQIRNKVIDAYNEVMRMQV